jgi:hypothetical protein
MCTYFSKWPERVYTPPALAFRASKLVDPVYHPDEDDPKPVTWKDEPLPSSLVKFK